ncbi:MAG: hypothetical protein IJ419_08505 [Agathobacter sp.]|nr:hypothetical protein [Agathobacter sp.]
MKKIRVVALGFVALLLLSACGDDDINVKEFDSLYEEVQVTFDEIKGNYKNLEFQIEDVDMPEGLEEVAIYRTQKNDFVADMEVQDAMELMVSEIFPKLLGVDKINLDCVYDVSSRTNLEDGSVTYDYYDDIMAKIDSYDELPLITYHDNANYIGVEFYPDGLNAHMNHGVINRMLGSNSAFAILGNFTAEKTYNCVTDDLSDSYMLLDGPKTVAEAQKEMEEYLNSVWPVYGEEGNGFKHEIVLLQVGKFADREEYCFHAMKTLSYNGIKLRDFRDNIRLSYDGMVEMDFASQSFMCESNKVDVSVGLCNNFTTPELVKTMEELVPYAEVLDIVSTYMTGDTTFKVDYAGLRYGLFISDNVAGYTMVPFWQFEMVNPNDDSRIVVCVNLETGEVESGSVE